jgi:hypothetical protein
MNVNAKTLIRLRENFENKVCTIFTTPVCKTFTERVWREHYAVRITEISNDGIWAEHPYAKTKSFFVFDQVVFIQEEVELDPKNPLHAKMIKEYESQTGEKIFSDVSPHLAPDIDYGQVELDDIAEPNVLPVMQKQMVEEPSVKESVFVDINSLDELAKFTKNQSQIKSFSNMNLPNVNKSELVQIR